MPNHILRIDGSARHSGSVSRDLTDQVIARLSADTTTIRDLSTALPLINEDWINANFTPADERTAAQKDILSQSDALVQEIKDADSVVIGVPIYNFGVPAALKAWVDLVCRAGVTFSYTAEGPKGLLEGKRAVIVVASGGTEAGSGIDFASTYMRHVLGFIGITDVEIVAADRLSLDAEASKANAQQQLEGLAA